MIGVGLINLDIEDMVSWMKRGIGSFPFNFLGVPVGANMFEKPNYTPIFRIFHINRSTRKVKSLFLGGKLVLCKAILNCLTSTFFSLLGMRRALLLLVMNKRESTNI